MSRRILESTDRRLLVLLVVLCFLASLPGFFTLPPLDRDESRFAQATRQMLETGDFVNIRLGNAPRYEKPIGIYWLQAAATTLFGQGERDRIWTYRLPSLLGALAAAAATFLLVRAFASTEAAFFAGVLLGFSLLVTTEAKIAKTDAVLLATVAAFQAVILRVYLGARLPAIHLMPRRGLVLFGWAACGLGILVKGPLILLVSGATVLALSLWDKEWRWIVRLYPLAGLLIVLCVVLPWAVAIGVESHGQFFQKSLGQDFALKLMGDQESHGAPPGYYTALVSLTFWPGTLLLLPGLLFGFAERRAPPIRFLLAWASSTWLMFELAPTKLPHYVLPAYPALAALAALWLTERRILSDRDRIALRVSLVLFVVVGLVLAAFLVWAPLRFGSGDPWWLDATAILGAVLVIAAVPAARHGRRKTATAFALGSALVLYGTAGFATAPRLQTLWLSERLADAVARHAMPGDPPVVTAGYAEPSITFLLGTRTALEDGAGAGARASRSGGLALVETGEDQAFLSAVGKEGASVSRLEEIRGLNYSRGRPLRIALYRVTPRER